MMVIKAFILMTLIFLHAMLAVSLACNIDNSRIMDVRILRSLRSEEVTLLMTHIIMCYCAHHDFCPCGHSGRSRLRVMAVLRA